MIYLFDKSKNLIGTIKQRHTINAIFEREVNGLYTLSVDLPVKFSDREGSFDYYSKIDKASYIGHYDLEDKFQMHRLINVDVENGEIHIDAIHIFFDEAKAYGVVAEQKYLKREISYIAPNVFGQIGWTLKDYDPSPTGNVSLYDVSLLEARTLLLETYGFEMDVWLDFDGIKVTSKNYSLKKRIGKTTTKRYTYGTNVLSIKSEEDFGEIYTAVIGLGADQDAIDARIAAAKYEADREAVRKERDRLTAEYKKVRSSYDAARKAVIAKYEADVAAWRTERARLLALRKQKKKVTIPKKPVYPKAAPRPKAPKLPAYPKKPKEPVVKTVTEQTREDMKRRVNYSKVVWSKPSKPLNKAAGSRVLVDPVTTEAFGYRDAQGVATPKVKVVIFEDIEDPNELIQKSYEWLQENSRPKALFTAEVVDGDTRVELGDTVTVIYRDIDKVVPIRVAKTTDDLLVKKRKIEFGDLEHVKENDKMKEFVAELKSVKRNFNDALYKRKLEFDTMFADQEESLKTDFEIALEQAQIDVDAFAEEMNITIDTAQEDFMESVEVSLVRAQEDAEERAVAMEQALREEISAQNTALSSDIANSYTQAVTDAEAKAKALDATITQTVIANKDAADKTMGELNAALGSTNSKVGTIEQNVTAVKDSVNAISQWKADKGAAIDQTINAVSTKAWMTDINPITKRVETAEASITTNANEILKRVTKTEFDSTTGRIEGVANTAKSTAESNTTAITTVSGQVGNLEQWRTDKGAAIDQTINAVSTKVWQNDIDKLSIGTTNLLYNSAIRTASNVTGTTKELIVGAWAFRSVYGSWVQEKLLPNTEYTISYEVEILSKPEGTNNSSRYGSAYLYSTNTPSSRVWMAKVSADFYNKGQVGDRLFVRNTFTTPLEIALNTEIIFYNTYVTDSNGNRIYSEVKFRDIMIVKGNKIGSYQPAPEDAENRMTEISATAEGALTKATTIGNDYVKQSAVLVQSDGVLIGSKKVSGAEIASAISVTPSSVDIITKAMRITGDMAVAGDIKTLSLQAVNADIANLRANILTADSVTATALKADTALMDKLFVNDLLTNKLVSQTVYSNSVKALSVSAVRADIAWLKSNVITAGSITTDALAADAVTSAKLKVDQAFVDKLMASTIYTDAIKAKSLEAVNGDIANLRSKIITTDVIKASNIASDLAVVDKIFASDALISRLTSKTAFVRDINSISINTNQLNVSTIMGEAGKLEGGISIRRPDGATAIDNGMIKNEYIISTTMPEFMSSVPPSSSQPNGGVSHFYRSRTYFATTRYVLSQGGTYYSDFGRLAFYRFFHTGRYAVLRVAINCKNTGGVVMIRNNTDTIYEIASVAQNDSRADSADEVYLDLVEDLGRPSYSRNSFYVYFKPNSQGSSTAEALIRIQECRITDYL